jgi:hypothetical protein
MTTNVKAALATMGALLFFILLFLFPETVVVLAMITLIIFSIALIFELFRIMFDG